MGISAVQGLAAQQSLFQQQMGVAMLRQAANASQAVARLVENAAAQPPPAPTGGRGSLVDVLA